MAFDPAILFNEGYNDVFEIVLPEGSLLNPRFPAALSNRLNTHTRFFDCQSGALGQNGARPVDGRRLRHQPVLHLHRRRTRTASTSRWSSCSSAASRAGPSATASTGTPGGRCSARRRSSTWRTTTRSCVERYGPSWTPAGRGCTAAAAGSRRCTASAGRRRSPIHDDRACSPPWGIGGGQSGGRSSKTARRADGTREELRLEDRQPAGRARRPHHLPHRRRGRLGRPARARPGRRRARRAAPARLDGAAERDYGVVAGRRGRDGGAARRACAPSAASTAAVRLRRAARRPRRAQLAASRGRPRGRRRRSPPPASYAAREPPPSIRGSSGRERVEQPPIPARGTA